MIFNNIQEEENQYYRFGCSNWGFTVVSIREGWQDIKKQDVRSCFLVVGVYLIRSEFF